MEQRTAVLRAEDYVSVREAARQLGVSARTVYGCIEAEKLPALRIGASIAVPIEALQSYQHARVGRPRTRPPVWRVPAAENQHSMTMIMVNLRPGQQEQLERKLAEIRAEREHLLPGTVARYITQNLDNPQSIRIYLFWRELVMPPKEEREAALAALRADLASLLDWETASTVEGLVLLNA